eukprot:4735382-Pleurochrysis_carterae.AAC.4
MVTTKLPALKCWRYPVTLSEVHAPKSRTSKDGLSEIEGSSCQLPSSVHFMNCPSASASKCYLQHEQDRVKPLLTTEQASYPFIIITQTDIEGPAATQGTKDIPNPL